MSFHFTQSCAFIAYSFVLWVVIRVVYGGKDTHFFKNASLVPFFPLQAKRHIRWQANNVVFQRKALRMDDVTRAYPLMELLLEPRKRGG